MDEQPTIQWILSPHPACKTRGDLIDIYPQGSKPGKDVPFMTVLVDVFWEDGNTEIHDALWNHKKTIKVSVTVAD